MYRATKKQVYEACNQIALGKETYSCLALEKIADDKFISIDYASFYGKMSSVYWFFGDEFPTIEYISGMQNLRIMLLLMYLEARNDV